MATKIKSDVRILPVASLVEDMSIYPRHAVDSSHVGALVEAIESGVELPPIVADMKSKRVTDGWHRLRAYCRVNGEKARVSVELIDYPDDTAMLRDAVARNSAHGRKLDTMDRVRCANMLNERGVPTKEIAVALHVTESKVEAITMRVVRVPPSSPNVFPGTSLIATNRTTDHLRGARLTKVQAEACKRLPGTQPPLYIRQVYDAVKHKLLDMTNAKIVAELRMLRDLLNSITLPEPEAEEG